MSLSAAPMPKVVNAIIDLTTIWRAPASGSEHTRKQGNEGSAHLVLKLRACAITYTRGNSVMTETDNDRSPLTEAQDRLLDLLVQQDEASGQKDWPRVNAL